MPKYAVREKPIPITSPDVPLSGWVVHLGSDIYEERKAHDAIVADLRRQLAEAEKRAENAMHNAAIYRRQVDEAQANARTEAKNDKIEQLKSEVGSCSCLTKTPEIKYHDPNCRYRLLRETPLARTKTNAEERLIDLQLEMAAGVPVNIAVLQRAAKAVAAERANAIARKE